MSVASTKVTNKLFLVIEELGGVHGHGVDFETTSFALVAKANCREQIQTMTHGQTHTRARTEAYMRSGEQS